MIIHEGAGVGFLRGGYSDRVGIVANIDPSAMGSGLLAKDPFRMGRSGGLAESLPSMPHRGAHPE
jgi:hypothetical protein